MFNVEGKYKKQVLQNIKDLKKISEITDEDNRSKILASYIDNILGSIDFSKEIDEKDFDKIKNDVSNFFKNPNDLICIDYEEVYIICIIRLALFYYRLRLNIEKCKNWKYFVKKYQDIILGA